MFNDYAVLIKKDRLNENVFSFLLKCKEISSLAEPGQFVNILIEGLTLRRPFSICEVKEEFFRVVFRVCGKGTQKMANWQEGKRVNVIGPLGKGFKAIDKNEKLLLVGGGIGIVPLVQLSKKADFFIVLAGFNSKKEVILKEEFGNCMELKICTVDGSYGEKGLVTNFIEDVIKKYDVNRIAACGPEKMLETVADVAKKCSVFCEVSLEERMGCGFGACLGCKHIFKVNGYEKSLHVCKDGPVFVV